MQIRTDDEVYRVDSVWLGPPRATFPFRARYVAWGIGALVFLLVLSVERRVGIGFSFFSTGWAVVITIVLTRLIGTRITHERPLPAVASMWVSELTAPRQRRKARHSTVGASAVRVAAQRPRPARRETRRETRRPAPRPNRMQRRALQRKEAADVPPTHAA